MPVKWTPEIDQILLLKILETSEVSPKYAEIAARWPAGVERPTPRAVSERISKIREKAKASGTASHFAVPSAASNPSTPRKKPTARVTKKPAPNKTNGTKASTSKRKRNERMSDDDDSEASTFRSSNNASDASDEETPQKKPKLNAKGKANSKELIKVKAEEEENGMFDSEETAGGSNFANHVDDYA